MMNLVCLLYGKTSKGWSWVLHNFGILSFCVDFEENGEVRLNFHRLELAFVRSEVKLASKFALNVDLWGQNYRWYRRYCCPLQRYCFQFSPIYNDIEIIAQNDLLFNEMLFLRTLVNPDTEEEVLRPKYKVEAEDFHPILWHFAKIQNKCPNLPWWLANCFDCHVDFEASGLDLKSSEAVTKAFRSGTDTLGW